MFLLNNLKLTNRLKIKLTYNKITRLDGQYLAIVVFTKHVRGIEA